MTHLVEFGYPERFVTEQVGHTAASTTAIYTSVSNDFKNQAPQRAMARLYPDRDTGQPEDANQNQADQEEPE